MLRLLVCLSAALAVCSASAQDYPHRPIRIIVPFAPGGATDVPARLIAPKMSEALGQPVVIENRPGAGGIVGIEAASKAPPDGYTFLMATNGELVMNPWIYPKLPYNAFDGFTPISIVVESPLVMLVSQASPISSARQLFAEAKAKPDTLTYATAGTGSTSHVLTEMLAQKTGIKLVHIPYKGGAPASAAIASGEVAFGLLNLGSAVNLVKAGRARPLAITSGERAPELPDVPTMAEVGVPDFVDGIWIGIAAPAGVPGPIIARIHSEVVKALKSPDVAERLSQIGVRAIGSTPAEAEARIKREIPRYREAIRRANIRAD
ncbi:MAG TPA: tripartite tricarboxylate transporter substrate binding protein [Candidatus Binataceae bacterium]|nr:tripartite tricarboxylate transporter substrate binding protein [Candidatus Binataceae bacterium]